MLVIHGTNSVTESLVIKPGTIFLFLVTATAFQSNDNIPQQCLSLGTCTPIQIDPKLLEIIPTFQNYI